MKVKLVVEVESDGVDGQTLIRCLTGSAMEVTQAAVARQVYEGSTPIAPPGIDHPISAYWKLSYVVPPEKPLMTPAVEIDDNIPTAVRLAEAPHDA